MEQNVLHRGRDGASSALVGAPNRRRLLRGLSAVALLPSAAWAQCPCTNEEELAEFREIIRLYNDAVNKARTSGYQCGNDKGYVDKGDGKHPVGNCADWAQVSWAPLRSRKWKCWKITKVEARHKFTSWVYHHFVYVESCSGTGYYLDPWRTGKPDVWEKSRFWVTTGFWGGWIMHPMVTHHPGDAPQDPGKDP
ncbi:hypothetical protein [Phenylobacterium sp.]|uniref:hypothetical protein n=1 Tax=Phenylobacterium sp. TaxID=1871053 RepID=UPI002C395173|nr:hypothetical protein [Phenylobacterium sp.]HLZ75109.1 hypothetical protein [Phenylobacterium sp.]